MIFLDLVFAMGSGVLSALAFPKIGLPFLAWIGLIPLLFLLSRLKPKRSFFAGWVSGTVFYGILMYWIPQVPAHYGNMSPVVSVLIYLLLILLLALTWALFGLGFSWIRARRRTAAFWAAPFLWVALEYVLTHVLTGFPWGLLGLSQYRNLGFIQIAAVTGVYGVSFLMVLFQSLFVASIRLSRRIPFAVGMTALVLAHLGGFISLREIRTTPDSFTAAVIQGNVSSSVYWTQTSTEEILDLFKQHLDLSRQSAAQGAGLIVWPEFTVPLCFSCNDTLSQRFKDDLGRFVRETRTTLLLGTNETSGPPGEPKYFNTSLCLKPDGIFTTYAKMHLVPFGEYTPYKKIFGFIEKVTHAIGEVTPGTEPSLHAFRATKFGTPICYEIIFPDLVRRFTKAGGGFLVTITNDGWYGTTSAPYQHFANAVFRAVENRRFVLRAATTGISGIIDPYGRIRARSEIGVQTLLTATITPATTLTFYARFGDIFSFLSLTLSALFFILALFKRDP